MDDSDPLFPGSGGSGGGGGYTNYFSFSINTNLLWLQITNVSSDTAYAALFNGTDQVYAIWATPDLLIPFSLWTVGAELFPTNSTTNCLPFTVPTLGQPDLFLKAEDWTGVYANGLPCWWTWYYFHTLDLSWDSLDANDHTLGHDFTNHLDPDTIAFTIAVTNTEVNTANPNLPLLISAGVPEDAAVLVNDTNLADAVWQSFNGSSVVAMLGADGDYTVTIGLRGFSANATETWQTVPLVKDTVAPGLTVTSPVGGPLSQTPVQFQGFASKALSTLTFGLGNAVGTFTNQQAYLTGVFYDTNLLAYTTNYFQSDDIDLASGTNIITLYATDWAGNETNMSFTVDYVPGTNPPVLTIIWPPAGTAISGGNFTLQAQVDQPTATISATAGATTVPGLIERSGMAWVQNLPLTSGTNSVTVTVSDANGSTSTNFSVVENDLGLVIDPLTGDELNQPSVSVFGTIGDPSLSVVVNGTNAIVDGEGDWEADDVTVSPMGTAIISVQVYSGDPVLQGVQNLYQAQPVTVGMMSYSGRHEPDVSAGSETINWSYQNGGDYENSPFGNSEISSNENGVAYIDYGGNVYPFSMPWEYASVTTPFFWIAEPFWYGNYTQTRVMVEPSGQTAAGTTNLYLVFANASEFSTCQMEYGLLESTYGWEYGELLKGTGSDPDTLGYAGNVPLPPEWLQIRGQTLLNSGITNSDGSVSGVALVSAPAGKNVEVTPVATQVHQNWSYTFNAQAFNVTLQIIDANTGTNLSAQTNTVIVGQQMNLTCQLSVTNSFMTNYVLTNFQWTISGQTVKQSIQFYGFASNGLTITYGTNTLIQNSDLQTNNTSFYWIDGGTNLEVDCMATVQGTPVCGKAFFNVQRPIGTFTAITTTNIPPVNINTNSEFNGLLLQYGLPNFTEGSEGIYFIFSVATPTNGAGSFGFLQVINSTLRRYISNTGLAQKRAGTNCLDHVFGPPVVAQTMITAAGTNSSIFQDSPGDLLVTSTISRVWSSANDNFSSYLMYRPSGNTNQTIWVTLRKIDWNWSGAATNEAGNWMLEPGYPTPLINPISIDSFELPTWNGQFLGLPIVPDN